jgi:FkbM family methyltransferase
MADLSTIYRQIRRSPSLSNVVHALPTRMRFYDGRTRTVPLGLWRLARIWATFAATRRESETSYDAYEGGDFLDIGAFEGWYSVLLAPRAADGDTFVSIEPDERAFPQLQSTLAMLAGVFPHVRFVPIPKAAGDGRPVAVSFPRGTEGHPRFSAVENGGDGVATVAVDRLVEQLGLSPRFVKIDVEGAEYFALRGLQEVLAEHHPRVVLEVHPEWQPEGVSVPEITALLERHGYRGRDTEVAHEHVRQLWT